MRKDLLRRLEKLEARQPNLEVGGLFWPIEIVNPQLLPPNGRIVEDWYLDSEYRILYTRERISTDPADQGRNYREAADGQTIECKLQREIIVVNNAHYYRVLSISQEDISIDSETAE